MAPDLHVARVTAEAVYLTDGTEIRCLPRPHDNHVIHHGFMDVEEPGRPKPEYSGHKGFGFHETEGVME